MNTQKLINDFINKTYPSNEEDAACMWFHFSDRDIYRRGVEDGIELILKQFNIGDFE